MPLSVDLLKPKHSREMPRDGQMSAHLHQAWILNSPDGDSAFPRYALARYRLLRDSEQNRLVLERDDEARKWETLDSVLNQSWNREWLITCTNVFLFIGRCKSTSSQA